MIDWSFYTPLIAYLIDLGEILKDLPLDYLVISETTFNESFPNAQFKLNGYEVRKRRNRRKNELAYWIFYARFYLQKT